MGRRSPTKMSATENRRYSKVSTEIFTNRNIVKYFIPRCLQVGNQKIATVTLIFKPYNGIEYFWELVKIGTREK